MLTHLSRQEGLARALPPAMAAGKPVIACDCDGAGEVCLDGQTGFLIEPGRLDPLANRVLPLPQDRALREQQGQCGRELVRERFPVERTVEDLRAFYRRLLPKGGAVAWPPDGAPPARDAGRRRQVLS